MAFADEMEQYDEQWEEDAAKERGSQFKTLKDGKHQVIVDESRIEEDNGVYTWFLRFQNKNGSIRKWNNLDHEVGRSIAAQDAKLMGYEGKLSGLEEACESGLFLDLVCEINIVTKPGKEDRDFTNVYLNRVLGKGDPAEFAQEGGDEEGDFNSGSSLNDDDIPF